MIQLSFDELLDLSPEVEHAVDATDGIDRWCSTLDWVAPVAMGFVPNGSRLLLQSSEGNGFVLLGYYRRADTVFLAGIEPLWGFASPIIGPDIQALAEELSQFLATRSDWSMLLLAGLPSPPHPLTAAVAKGLRPLGISLYGEGITRRVAELSDGYSHWLESRSGRFRRNLRQIRAQAVNEGVTIVGAADDSKLFERLFAIEQTSWKGQDGSGIVAPEMSVMYDLMIARLRERRRLQAFVAQLERDGQQTDIGYILGGVRDRRYRGLQISFSRQYRQLSVGNLLQDHQLRFLADHDLADSYDMGMDFDYKQRWADRAESSITLILQRSSAPHPLN